MTFSPDWLSFERGQDESGPEEVAAFQLKEGRRAGPRHLHLEIGLSECDANDARRGLFLNFYELFSSL